MKILNYLQLIDTIKIQLQLKITIINKIFSLIFSTDYIFKDLFHEKSLLLHDTVKLAN